MSKVMGWDIGGAHLKAALLDSDGNILNILQLPCELWRGLDKLEAALKKALAVFGVNKIDVEHAVTMTGELVDLFQNRQQGVTEISNVVANFLGNKTLFYAAGLSNQNHDFVSITSVLKHASNIASANWHASASLLAKYVPNALLVDIGSTTTDIIPIVSGSVAMGAYSDAQRMQNDTLVYTGVVRTPVMALAQKLPFEGAETNVAAEYFATMADVYRLTGDLLPAFDVAETADGKGKNLENSAQRLARMVGHDAGDKPLETWKTLAVTCKSMHIAQIKKAILKHTKLGAPIIGAGAGEFLVKIIAAELNCPFMTVAEVLNINTDESLSICFPAYAVARLKKYAFTQT